MKKRTQGEAPRIEACPQGGEHVLMRPVQIYCDRCRPKKRQQTLERQRQWRERHRAGKVGGPAGPSAADEAGVEATVHDTAPGVSSDQLTLLEQRILETVAQLQTQSDKLQKEYRRAERAKTSLEIGNAARLARDVLTVELAANFLRLAAAAVPDELASRRGGRSA